MTACVNASKIIATYADYKRAKGQFVPSPCVSVCHMEPDSQLCGGCLRTLDEIAAWSGMDDDGKLWVWQQLVQRASHAIAYAGPLAALQPELAAAPEPRA